MLEKRTIIENLQKTNCPRCGASLEGAKIVPVSEAPLAIVAHAICPVCKAESMVTITQAGSGATSVVSDLKGNEYGKFLLQGPVNYDDLLDLHIALKKENIWKLLHKQEKN